MKTSKNVIKKILAGILSITMIGPMFQGTGININIKAETETETDIDKEAAELIDVCQYATPEQLTDPDNFSLDSEKTGMTGLVYFGKNNISWYIAGSQVQDQLVLVSRDPLIKYVCMFDYSIHPQWAESGKNIPVDPSYGVYATDNADTVTSVYANHYGVSNLRQQLINASTDENYFSVWQQNMLCATTYENYDSKNNCSYTLNDKLYPMSLDSTKTYLSAGSGNQLKITSSRLVLTGMARTWLRGPLSMNYNFSWVYNGDVVDRDEFSQTFIEDKIGTGICPVATIDLKDVLWASTVPTDNSPQNNIMKLRYRDDEAELGNIYIRPDKKEIRLSGVPESATLIIQNNKKYYRKSVKNNFGTKLSALDVTADLDSFEGCKVWIEKTKDDGKTIAVDAVQEDKYSISANLFDITLTDSDYSAGKPNLAQVKVKSGVVGIGEFSISYECNGETVKEPEEPGVYEVYVNVAQGDNYQAAEHLYAGKYTIRRIVKAADLRYKAPANLKSDGTVKTATVSPIADGMGSITIKYKYGNGNYTKAPKAAGEYTVYADVSQGNLFCAASDIELGHFILKGYPSKNLLTYTAPDNLLEDGTIKNAVVNAKTDISGLGEITVKYKRGGTDTYMDSPPEDEGQYKVYACLTEGVRYLADEIYIGEFTVKKAIVNELELITAEEFTYDGNEKAVDVRIKTGVEGVGTVSAPKYKKSGESAYMEGTPSDAGIYEVYVDITAGSKYIAAADVFVGTFTIRDTVTEECFTSINTFTATYNGYPVSVNVKAKENISGLGEISVNYKRKGESDYLNGIPVDTGDYEIFVSTEKGSLYNASSDIPVGEFKIRKSATAETFSYMAPDDISYNGEGKAATVRPADGVRDLTESDFSIMYRDSANQYMNNPPYASGDYDVYVKVSDSDIYIESGYIYLGSFSILADNRFRDNNLNYSAPADCVYDGQPKGVQVSYKDGVNAYGRIELYYKKDGQSEIIYEPKEAGNYRAYANIFKKSTDGESSETEASDIYITDFTIIDTVKQFVTKTELLTKFRLTDGFLSGRLKFGYCNDYNFNGVREWYIAGIDQQNDNSLTLLSRMPFHSPYSYNLAKYGYGDNSYADIFDFDTDYTKAMDYYFCETEQGPINGTLKSMLGRFEQSSDYFTTSEIGRMKSTTVTSRTIKNNYGEDLFTKVTGKLYLPDAEDKSAFRAEDSRKTTIYVGTKNIIPVDLSRIEPVYETGLDRIDVFWLRSFADDATDYFPNVLTVKCRTERNIENSNVNASVTNDNHYLLPAVDLDLSQVLFASDANPADGDGALKTDDAMTLRYLDSSQILGCGILSEDKSSVSISGADTDNEYLVVRSTNSAYAKKVTGSMEVQASDVDSSLESFEGCQVWLEKTDRDQRETIASVISSTKVLDEELPEIDYSKKMNTNFRLDSSLTSGNAKYEAGFTADYAGTLNLYDARNVLIAHDILIDPRTDSDCRAEIIMSLSKGTNSFKVVFTPYSAALQGNLLGENETLVSTPVELEFEVSYKEYRTQENVIYVSDDGSPSGKGSKSSPLDIYTAVAYAKPGQYIVLRSDIGLDKELVIPRGTAGTGDKLITIMSDPTIDRTFGIYNKKALLGVYIYLQGDYIHLYNIDFRFLDDHGTAVTISGNHNIVEKCNDLESIKNFITIQGDTSERACMWPSCNRVISCTSSSMDMSASIGFEAGAYIGEGNIFRYCIASGNSRGFSFGTKCADSNASITAEQCVAKCNVNGFYITGQSLSAKLDNCIAYNNSNLFNTSGTGVYFDSDHGLCSNCTLYNNYQNIIVNNGTGKSFTAKDCIMYNGDMTIWQDNLAGGKSDSCSAEDSVTADWFESLDTSIEPVIKDDGSIDMGGLCTLTQSAADGDGAILSANAEPTTILYNDIDECPAHHYVNGICTECNGYMEDPTAQEIQNLAATAGTFITNAQKYTTKSINAITNSLTRVDTVTDKSSKRIREEIFNGIADALAASRESTSTVVLSSDPADSGVLSGGGRYAAGDYITLKADVVDGYTFKGWYQGTETTGEAYSTDKITAYEVKQDDTEVNFTALYSSNGNKDLSLTVGMGSVTYSYNKGKNTGTWNDDITSVSFGKGTGFTVEAVPENNSQFLYWINSDSGRILSESPVYSFYIGDNLSLQACYKNQTPENHYVVFKDLNGGILWFGDVADKSAAEEPAHGSFTGYEFDGWDKEFTSVTEDMIITARYRQTSGFTVAVNGGTIAGAKASYSYGELVTATAQETDGAKYFSGWYEGEVLVSDQLSYSFYVTADTELSAKYQGDEILQQQPMVRMQTGSRQAADNDEQVLPLNVIWSVTEGYSFVGAGLVRTYLDDRIDSLSLESADGTDVKKNSTKLTTTAGNYAFTLRIAEASKLSTLYAKGYLVYKNDMTGEVKTVYTDLYTSQPLN